MNAIEVTTSNGKRISLNCDFESLEIKDHEDDFSAWFDADGINDLIWLLETAKRWKEETANG